MSIYNYIIGSEISFATNVISLIMADSECLNESTYKCIK